MRRSLPQTGRDGLNQMTERLDRVEYLLTALTERQDRFQAQLEAAWQQQDAGQVELRESINDVVSMIGSLAEQQEATDQRTEAVRQQQAETDQWFENLLNDARVDRQLNEQEHRAFRETFQTLLAEISRIWRRLAG